ncbi:hypothetical protein AB0F81_39480 [Actinoplanes sp. NPDC024001]|uniref:hypothetical protein n=1 Tax=Actinoplanes sp. NPDC024001 TaxID=3154598 RepID=UPI00340EA13E
MRMVFTGAPEDVIVPALHRLVDAFGRWAADLPADPFVVEVLLEHRWSEGDGLLCRWPPSDLRAALCDWFPRKVTMAPDEWPAVVPTVHAFVDFLFAAGLADARCATAADLHAGLDALAGDFAEAMGDESRYGPAKFWSMRMLAAGVDLEDETATARYIAEVRSGRITVDQQLLDRMTANHLAADQQPPPRLPLVAVPDDSTLAELASRSVAVGRVRGFVAWVGDGRPLTATGRLRLADARELITRLDLPDEIDPVLGGRAWRTPSSDELYDLSIVFAWARAARVVRVVKGRLLPVKSAAKLVADPLALAHRMVDAFAGLGAAVAMPGSETLVRWRFGEAMGAVLLPLYLTQRPLARAEIAQLTWDLLEDGAEAEPWWRDAHDGDLAGMLEQLAVFGVVELDRKNARLTPLGTGLLAAQLRREGADVPTVASLLDETAEVVVAYAADAPAPLRRELLDNWVRHHPETGPAELRALAGRTDDRTHRKLALRIVGDR